MIYQHYHVPFCYPCVYHTKAIGFTDLMTYIVLNFLFVFTNQRASPNQIRQFILWLSTADCQHSKLVSDLELFWLNFSRFWDVSWLNKYSFTTNKLMKRRYTQTHTHMHTQPYQSKVAAAICSASHEYLIHHVTWK